MLQPLSTSQSCALWTTCIQSTIRQLLLKKHALLLLVGVLAWAVTKKSCGCHKLLDGWDPSKWREGGAPLFLAAPGLGGPSVGHWDCRAQGYHQHPGRWNQLLGGCLPDLGALSFNKSSGCWNVLCKRCEFNSLAIWITVDICLCRCGPSTKVVQSKLHRRGTLL